MNLLAILAKGGCRHNQTGCQAAKEFAMENTICSNDSQRTYTAEQVARILGVSVRTAYYLCERTTEFKVIRLGKRCLRVHKESFDRWLDGQTSVS
jgi:predicted DNA-binding transcriptional regulator AlpA